MPDISCQTENVIFASREKNYFDYESDRRQILRNKIKDLVYQSDLKLFCQKIGLRIDEIKFAPNDTDFRLIPPKITIAPFNLSKEMVLFKWMTVRDLINISCKKYVTLRKFLKTNYIAQLPCIDNVRVQQINIDNFFCLYKNDFGFFLCPEQKIKNVCYKFLERNGEIRSKWN